MKYAPPLLAALAALAACTTPAPTPDPEPVEPVTPEPAPVELSLEERLMSALCPEEFRDGEECTVCPSETAVGQSDPGDAEYTMTISAHRKGAYTAKGAEEYVVELLGCGFPDGSTEGVLVRASGEGFDVVARSALLSTKECQFPRGPKGTEMIVCLHSGGNQGYIATEFRQLDASDGLEARSIKSLLSNSGACPTDELRDEVPDGFRVYDVNEDGLDDVVLDYHSLYRKVPEPYEDACAAINDGYSFGEDEIHEDVFIQRDGKFVPE
jgi:hypothetical protein